MWLLHVNIQKNGHLNIKVQQGTPKLTNVIIQIRTCNLPTSLYKIKKWTATGTLRPCYAMQFSQLLVSQWLKILQCKLPRFGVETLLHCAIFSATCLTMLLGMKKKVCVCTLVKTAVKLRGKLLEGWYTVQWCCQLLQSVEKSRAAFYFVQHFIQQKICKTTHVTLCISPATCLAMPLHSVTEPPK